MDSTSSTTVAAPVDEHAAAARLAAEPFLLRELDALLADVVVAGEAYDVARHFAGRIETPVFVLVVNAFDLQRRDALGDFRRHLLREEDEIVAVLELLRERLRRRLERPRELRELLRRRVDLAGKRPDRLHRRRDRERLAGAIDDAAAMRGQLDFTAVARAALLLQERVVDPLQV